MRRFLHSALALAFGLGALIFLFQSTPFQVQAQPQPPLIVGSVVNHQNQPISGVQVNLVSPGQTPPLAQAQTQTDGRYVLDVPKSVPNQLSLAFSHAHFTSQTLNLSPQQVQILKSGQTLSLPATSLALQVGAAFWVATLVFVLMLVLIAAGIFQNTLAALLSAVLLFAVSYLGRPFYEGLFVFGFYQGVSYIDWNVIFLIMGMMIVIAVVERTGVFQWLAFFAFRMSHGRSWLLLIILMLITGLVSAFLDNVTTMLLMAPITIQMSIALEMNPLALLMPEVLASNVIGISTLIGTPTNIIIGSYAHITFNEFLLNQTPGVLLAVAGLILYSLWIYHSELAAISNPSPSMLKQLEERARITQPGNLKKAGVVGAAMIVLFVFGEFLGQPPAVTALYGATALMIWVRPNVSEMIDAVDWTTLVFFMSLFIVVGGVQEVGLISLAAETIGKLVGHNLTLAMLVITWFSAVLSTVIANIPFTAAMLPIISFLTSIIPGAGNKVLYYCLSVGAAMGGNGSLIGASANMVTAGISNQAGYRITYMYFLKKGFPALVITVALAFAWLLIRFG